METQRSIMHQETVRRTRRRISDETKAQIVEYWVNGVGNVPDLIRAFDLPESTVYGILARSGVWPGVDDYKMAKKPGHKTATITLDYMLKSVHPEAAAQVEENARRKALGAAGRNTPALSNFILAAERRGFAMTDIADHIHMDYETVRRVVRGITPTGIKPEKKSAKPKPVASSKPVVSGSSSEPQPGLIKRIWHWIVG